MLFKKAGMTQQKYISHSVEDCFGKHTNQNTINDGLWGPVGSSAEAVKQYQKSDSKWKKELKTLKKQKNMLFSISKKSS